MSEMEKRGDAYENKFAHDAELQFKAEARRNKLLGIWVAGLLGKDGDDVAEYAKEVVRSDFDEPGHEDVFRKIRGDFDKAGVEQSDDQIRTAIASMMKEAVEQISAEK